MKDKDIIYLICAGIVAIYIVHNGSELARNVTRIMMIIATVLIGIGDWQEIKRKRDK